MTSVMAVSNTFLSLSFEESIPIAPIKLYCLLYFANHEYLQKYGKPLFSERFLTWKYGPVLRSAQEKFDSFANKAISKFAKDALGHVFLISRQKSVDIADIIDSVWEKYKCFDAIVLCKLLCSPGTAWRKAKEQRIECLRDEDIKAETGFWILIPQL